MQGVRAVESESGGAEYLHRVQRILRQGYKSRKPVVDFREVAAAWTYKRSMQLDHRFGEHLFAEEVDNTDEAVDEVPSLATKACATAEVEA